MKYLIVTILLLVIIFTIIMVFCNHYLKYIINPKKLNLSISKRLAEKSHYLDFVDESTIENYILTMKDDYRIPVYLLKNSSEKYVILSHGHTVTHYNSFKYAEIFYKLGYNIIMYDSRGHGSNEQSIISLGHFEAKDLKQIIDDTYKRYGNDIFLGLHGESMGAITSNLVLKYSPDIKFIISDSSFSNIIFHLKYFINYMFNLPSFLVYLGDLVCYIQYRYSFRQVNPDKYINDNHIPICFIHGLADDYIIPENTRMLYEMNKGYKELHLFENAKHAKCLQSDPERYHQIINDFTESVEKSYER